MSSAPSFKRILMTADTLGGVWTYALELARALEAQGVEVALATMGAPLTPDQRQEAQALRNLEVFESAYKLEWMEEPWRDVRAAGEWLLELEGRVSPDLVHLNGYAHGALEWRAPKVVVGHSCVLSWWRAVHGQDAPRQWDSYRAAVKTGLAAADVVVAPSRAMLQALGEFYGPLRAGIVIPNGRKMDCLGAQPKEKLVLSAGRLWDAAKNLCTLAAVAPGLPWPVYVAGEEQAPGGSRARYKHVRHLGCLSAPELESWFARASIYALPARYEPFGLSVLEAALAGCALVLGDIPSLREIWGDAAMFVSPEDTSALEAALKHLIGSPKRLPELAAKARCVATHHTPERMAAGYLQAYGEARQRRALA